MIVTPGDGRLRLRDGQQLQRRPRPPVIFCGDGDARVVVRRESFEDLFARDVRSEESRPMSPERTASSADFKVGLLGHGTVGSAFSALLEEAGRGDRALQRPPAGDQRSADAHARATSRRSCPRPTCSSS